MKTAVVLSVAILANSFGNVCLSKGMKEFDMGGKLGPAWMGRAAIHVLSDPWMILGVLLLLIFLGAYLAALSWSDLSFVLPATAPAYILTAGLSKIFLNETIPPARWGGIVLIVAGTWLVARTAVPSRKPEVETVTAQLAVAPRGFSPASGTHVPEGEGS